MFPLSTASVLGQHQYHSGLTAYVALLNSGVSAVACYKTPLLDYKRAINRHVLWLLLLPLPLTVVVFRKLVSKHGC